MLLAVGIGIVVVGRSQQLPVASQPVVHLRNTVIDEVWEEGKADRRNELAAIEGHPAPQIRSSVWVNGNGTPRDGKVVVLDFWATWCGPCITSIPHINALMDAYRDRGVEVIGICHPKGGDLMQTIVDQFGIRYPVCLDADGSIGEAYRVDGYPDYYIIAPDGTLLLADCRNDKVEEVLNAILPAKP